MLNTTHGVAAGWYPDPHGDVCLRRWDGSRWTQETRGAAGVGATGASAPGLGASGLGAGGVSAPASGLGRSSHPLPETGWAGVAAALRAALISREAVRVVVTLPGRAALTVNTFDHTYTWLDEPEELAGEARDAQIAFERSESAGPGQGQSLDGLLWRISRAAFPDRPAPWLQPDDLYRMQRWPNLTTINPELDDMRQAAMLANGMFTVEELAGFSDRPLQPTRSLINALSLMNTLKVAAPREANVFALSAPVAASAPSPAPARRPGLFQRLRERLGL